MTNAFSSRNCKSLSCIIKTSLPSGSASMVKMRLFLLPFLNKFQSPSQCIVEIVCKIKMGNVKKTHSLFCMSLVPAQCTNTIYKCLQRTISR